MNVGWFFVVFFFVGTKKMYAYTYSAVCTHQMDNDPLPSFQFSERCHSNRTWEEEKTKSGSIKTATKLLSAICNPNEVLQSLSFQLFSEFRISITATEHALGSSNRIEMNTLWTHFAFLGTQRNNERTKKNTATTTTASF